MNKPLVLIIIGGVLLGGLGAGAYLYTSRITSAPSPVSETPNVTPTLAPTMITWDDPAGFTLSYPDGLQVNKHDEDKENYAHVEFTDTKHPGRVIVWVKDLPRKVTDTVSWGKLIATSSAISFDTTLGGKPAQKVLISQPQKTMMTGIVYDGVLWYIEADLVDEPYWRSVFDSLSSTFAFKPIEESAPAAAAPPASETSVDEEEVLE